MKVKIRDGRIVDIELKPVTPEGLKFASKVNLSSKTDSERYYVSDNLEDFGTDSPLGKEEQDPKYFEYRREIIIDGELSGVCHLDDVSTYNSKLLFVGGVYLFPKYRGLGLNSVILDMMALISNASTIYLLIDVNNVASIKSSYGFVISNDEILGGFLEDYIDENKLASDYIVLKKYYK